MSFRTTFWLAAIATAFAVFIYVSDSRPPTTTQLIATGAPVVRLNPMSVQSIDISISNRFLRLERTNNAWTILNPRYPAQKTVVEAFIETAGAARQLGFLNAQEVSREPGGAKSFGLEPPRATVVFNSSNGKVRLEIGNRTPISDQIYVRRGGDSGVFLTDATLLEQLPFDWNEWRDPALINLSALSFDTVQFRSSNRSWEVRRPSGGSWSITKPVEARADTNRVLALLMELENARAVEFVTDAPTVDLEQYGLQMPEIAASFLLNSNVVATLEFGRSPADRSDVVYARRSQHTNIVLVAKDVASLLTLSYQKFHDPQLVSLPQARVERVDVQAAETFSLARTNNGWQVIAPKAFPADQQLVDDFLLRVNGLEIVSFAREAPSPQDLAALQLLPPLKRYSFFGVQSNIAGPSSVLLAQLDFGTNTVDTILAKRHDEIPVYVTPLARVLDLPQASWQLRSRLLWKINPNTLTSLVVESGEKRATLQRDTLTGWDRDIIRNEQVSELVFRLCVLQAERWTARGDAAMKLYGLDKSTQQITMHFKNPDGQDGSVTLRLGARGVRGNVYASASGLGHDSSTVFQLSAQLHIELLSGLFAPLGN